MTNTLKPLDSFLAFAPPLVGDEEIAEVIDTLKSGWLTTGPKTERFELALAERLGSSRGLALNSCTAALHLGLKVLGVGPGQGVVTSPLTFASTAHAVGYVGARPYLADIEAESGNLDPEQVRRFLTEDCAPDAEGRPRHRVTGDVITTLMPVHYGGRPVDLDAFWRLAGEFRLNMLEDAAHAIGAAYKGLPIGHPGLKPAEAGDLAGLTAFSFYATKNMTTGEGGYLAAGRAELIEKARVLSMYGISDSRRIWGRYAPKGTWVYDVAELGYKCNMTDIQAALGLHQLEKLSDFIAKRRERAAAYDRALADFKHLVETPDPAAELESARHLYPLRLKPGALSVDRDRFIEIMRDHNLGTSVLFIPLHYHSYYRQTFDYKEGDFPAAEKFFAGLINLPLSPAHCLAEIERAAELTAGLLRKYSK